MGFIMLLVAGFVIWMMLQSGKDLDSDPYVVAVKQCPPHKWGWVEVKDTEGTVVKHKLVCAVCGPMVTDDAPRNNGDYS